MKSIIGKRSEKLQKVYWEIFEHNNLDLVQTNFYNTQSTTPHHVICTVYIVISCSRQ